MTVWAGWIAAGIIRFLVPESPLIPSSASAFRNWHASCIHFCEAGPFRPFYPTGGHHCMKKIEAIIKPFKLDEVKEAQAATANRSH